jgi:hypothetical protein
MAGCCEHGDEPSGYIKCEGFHDKLRNYRLEDSVLLGNNAASMGNRISTFRSIVTTVKFLSRNTCMSQN